MMNFSQVMHDWRRMCNTLDKAHGEEACSYCPIFHTDTIAGCCDAIYEDWAANIDWDKVASIVETWAAKNPEPIYPTWYEWLDKMDIVTYTLGDFPEEPARVLTAKHLFDPIPADIAAKLGVKPKEGKNNV